MDWRGRKYYCVSFDFSSRDMRLNILKLVNGIKIHQYKNIPKQSDEMEDRGYYQFLLGVPYEWHEAVEYELRKAERMDDWCTWKEISRSKSVWDV